MPLAKEKVITRNWGHPDSWTLDAYRSTGGYGTLEKVLGLQPAQVIDEVKKSNLRGRGGAGFPTGLKWSFVPKDSPKPKYLAVNADESEPGTFKDRYILENDPHMLLEGIAIAASRSTCTPPTSTCAASSATRPSGCEKAIDEAYAAGIFGKTVLGQGLRSSTSTWSAARARTSAARRPALLESLEGKKGWPRLKPPFPAVVGLFGCPTVVNNVETLATVPAIFQHGAEWFAALGTDKSGGTRLVCLSGYVNRPGVYEVDAQTTLRELIGAGLGQGMPAGRKVKAVIPGGSSAPVLSADELDVALEFDALKALRNMAGSGGVIVMDDSTCMVRCLWRVSRFYAEESCGQCTPCREGTPWMTRISGRSRRAAASRATSRRCSTWLRAIAPVPADRAGQHHLRARRRRRAPGAQLRA